MSHRDSAAMKRRNSRLGLLLLLGASTSALAQQADLGQMSLDQLGKIEVISASRRQQNLADTAAAVYVISQEEIRNSVATTLPELLRSVPGLDIGRINGSAWAISTRGFAEQFTGKMLVLVDGRIAFDPLISGVVWADNDIELQDIERIEVIRGSGSTIWGANAFSGVINIITKPAQATQGMLVSTGLGTNERNYQLLRFGGKAGQKTSYRAYTKYFDDGPAGRSQGLSSRDSWRNLSGGFRIDSNVSKHDTISLEGNAFRGEGGKVTTIPTFAAPFTETFNDFRGHGGENFMSRWIHKASDGAETTAQASFGRIIHPELGLDVNGDVVGASVQHARMLGERHNLVFGGDLVFRNAHTLSKDNAVFWNPSNLSFTVSGGFIQDEMLLMNGTVRLTGGLRFEHNSFSGINLQPNARVLWKITTAQSVWFAYSLAARSPSPADTALNTNVAVFPGPAGLQELRVTGNPDIKTEKANSFETGYRIQRKKVFFDATAFYNGYSDLVGQEPGQPFVESGAPPRLVLPLLSENNQFGRSFGSELSLQWTPVQSLKVATSYSYNLFDLQQRSLSGISGVHVWGEPPRHKLSLGSTARLARVLTLDSRITFIDRRTVQGIPGFTQVDSALVCRPTTAGEFRIGAENLFNKEHIEFQSQQGTNSTVFGRRIYGRVLWHFGRTETH